MDLTIKEAISEIIIFLGFIGFCFVLFQFTKWLYEINKYIRENGQLKPVKFTDLVPVVTSGGKVALMWFMAVSLALILMVVATEQWL